MSTEMRNDVHPGTTSQNPESAARRPRLMPEPPKVSRRYGQWAGAVLFVVVAMLVAGWLWQQKSDRVEVLTLARPVSAGSVITRTDLGVADVAGLRDGVPASRSDGVVGKTAAVALVPGEVMTTQMLTSSPLPATGQTVVGMQLDDGRIPAGLAAGDVVRVLAVPPKGDPGSTTLLDHPVVLADHGVVVGARSTEGGDVRLSLVLADDVADRVSSYAAGGRVAVVQAPLGSEH